MIINIRKLKSTQHEYIAFTKSLCGKATYFVYFEDSIWGAVTLYNFIEMLKKFFQVKNVKIKISDVAVNVKNKDIMALLKGKEGSNYSN